MYRRFVTRAVVAPLVIAIATAAVPPPGLNDHVNKWATETVPAMLASADAALVRETLERQLLDSSADIAQLTDGLNRQVLETAVHVVGAREEILTRLAAATDYISTGTNASLARIDSWMTSMSLTVIAALPGGPGNASASVVHQNDSGIVEGAPRYTASVSLASLPALPVRLEVEQAAKNTLSENAAVESVAVAPAPQAELPAQPGVKKNADKLMLASVGRPIVPMVTPAPVAVTPPVAVAVAPIAVEPVAITPPAPVTVAQAAPVEEVKVAREEKTEEKQVFASLGRQATAADTAPAVEAKTAPAPEKASEFEDRHIDNGGADMPPSNYAAAKSAPMKLRALTRADIPSADKLASLGNSRSDASAAPAETQRVAFDEPAFNEIPVSVGKRKWIDETKYAGLGKPEALLEALRHLGANAKSLGLPPSLWCADFMNLILRKSGIKSTGSRAARSYLEYGTKIDEPRVGAIAIFSRGKNQGHIGIVRGTDGNGNPIIVSGNHNNKVAEATYPKSRVLAYVVPK